jgi:hypothetical protein
VCVCAGARARVCVCVCVCARAWGWTNLLGRLAALRADSLDLLHDVHTLGDNAEDNVTACRVEMRGGGGRASQRARAHVCVCVCVYVCVCVCVRARVCVNASVGEEHAQWEAVREQDGR